MPIIYYCRVDLDFPKVEVRFHHLTVESSVHIGSRALPTISNFIINITEVRHGLSAIISV